MSQTDRDPDQAFLPAIHVGWKRAWAPAFQGWGSSGKSPGSWDQRPLIPLPERRSSLLPLVLDSAGPSPPAGLLGLGVHSRPQRRALPAC